MDLIVFLIVGLLAGWIADLIVKDVRYGLIGDLVVGVVGAFIGGLLFSTFGLEAYGFVGSVVTAVVGAVILLFLMTMFTRKA